MLAFNYYMVKVRQIFGQAFTAMSITEDYKNHSIVASAFEEAKHKWISHVTISWTSDGRQHVHHIRPRMVKDNLDYFLNSFLSRRDADAFGVQEAKAWIDARLKPWLKRKPAHR